MTRSRLATEPVLSHRKDRLLVNLRSVPDDGTELLSQVLFAPSSGKDQTYHVGYP